MLTVEDYCKIRIAYRDGMSIREIARRFHSSRQKVRQVLEESEPRPYTLAAERPAPQLGPYKTLIEQILEEDQQAPRKQRHTRRSSTGGCGTSTATRAVTIRCSGTWAGWCGIGVRRSSP